MINYIFRVKGEGIVAGLTVVRAHTATDAREILLAEFSKPEEITITLVECSQELSFLN